MDAIEALDLLHNVRFKRGRKPTPEEDVCLHNAWDKCQPWIENTVSTLSESCSLYAIAEAVRCGILIAEVFE